MVRLPTLPLSGLAVTVMSVTFIGSVTVTGVSTPSRFTLWMNTLAGFSVVAWVQVSTRNERPVSFRMIFSPTASRVSGR